MSNLAASPPMLSETERERLLFEKQQQIVQRQLVEVREEYEAMQAKLYARNDRIASRESFSLSQFLPTPEAPAPRLLQEAIRFFETHDGCPLHACEACTTECGGVWIRMGHPCWQLVERIKNISNALTKRRDS